MSAIVGIFYFGEAPGNLANDGVSMMQSLRKYPADAAGIWQQGPVLLGCHAQWITPEAAHEKLPNFDEQLGLAITADAIIDNREELFRQLAVDPVEQKHMSDSELILYAYAKWGSEAPAHLLGDFAFLIWDQRKRLLFGARDLTGNRTLYYHHNRNRIAACTVILPLFSAAGTRKALNEEWLAEFLAIPAMFDSTDAHATVYEGIRQIPPAHSFIAQDGCIRLTRYGDLLPKEELRLSSNQEYEEAFRDIFRQAVTARLRTFRKVGATLSGGLDSGSVAGFAAQELKRAGKTLHTYSYVPSPDFADWTGRHRFADETPFIKATVEFVGNIADRYLDFPGKSPYTEIDDWLAILEGPYKHFENSFWIKGIYEEAAKDGAGVLLTGARGNFTISWGSAIDYYALLLRKFRWIHFYRELTQFSRQLQIGRSVLLPRIGRYAYPVLSRAPRGLHGRGRESGMDALTLIHPDFARQTNIYEKLRDCDFRLNPTPLQMFRQREQFFQNPTVLNMQGTAGAKLSLRYSLWERDPTCDPRVVRFCLSLPDRQYVQNGIGRSLIRRATAHILPDKVRLNRMGGVQSADWVQRTKPSWPSLAHEIEELCGDPVASRYMNVAGIKEAFAALSGDVRPELAIDPRAKRVLRSVIVYRFLKMEGR